MSWASVKTCLHNTSEQGAREGWRLLADIVKGEGVAGWEKRGRLFLNPRRICIGFVGICPPGTFSLNFEFSSRKNNDEQ